MSRTARILIALSLVGALHACGGGEGSGAVAGASGEAGSGGAGGAGAGGSGGTGGNGGAGGSGGAGGDADEDAGDPSLTGVLDGAVVDGDAGVPDAATELLDAGAPDADPELADAATVDAAMVEIDVCEDVSCRNGSCVVVRDQAMCECPPQFTGDICADCAPGHSGVGCATCEPGYLDRGGVCVATACVGVDCGLNGTCALVSGQAECVCKDGFDGDACEMCARGYRYTNATTCSLTLPNLSSPASLWLNGMLLSSMDILGNGDVSRWRNRIASQGGSVGNFSGSYQDNAHLPNYSLEQRGAVFDHDTMESLSDIPGAAEYYTMIFVMRWDHTTPSQTIWRSTAAGDLQPRIALSVHGSNVTFRHRGATVGPTDSVTADFFGDDNGPMHIVIAKRAPFLNGTIMALTDGTQQASSTATALPLSEPHFSQIGVAHNALSGHMDATLHEVIFIRGPITATDQQKLIDYLSVKWGL